MENNTIRLVVVDGATLNPGDLNWDTLQELGTCTIYERTPPEHMLERCREADILLVNKAVITKELMAELPQLKCICVTATGYNNVDLKAARERGIPVCNAVGYGSKAVAQHVFALLLELTNHVALHDQSVKAGEWSAQEDFAYWKKPITELAGRTMGIYGFGRIGQMVGRIARAMGMRVLSTHKHPERDAIVGVTFVPLETLFRESDIISLNAPLTAKNEQIVNARLFELMRPNALLINTGRGGLVHEEDLYKALKSKRIAGAALDVLATEPPPADHPLFTLDNCIITPHQAWASVAARQRLMDITIENVKGFLKGEPQNVVN